MIDENFSNMRRTVSVVNWIMSIRSHAASSPSIDFSQQLSVLRSRSQLDSVAENDDDGIVVKSLESKEFDQQNSSNCA